MQFACLTCDDLASFGSWLLVFRVRVEMNFTWKMDEIRQQKEEVTKSCSESCQAVSSSLQRIYRESGFDMPIRASWDPVRHKSNACIVQQCCGLGVADVQ